MKRKSPAQSLLESADTLRIVYYDGGIFDREGYAIQIVNSFAHLLYAPGGKPKVWKTEGGAYRAACRMRPDLISWIHSGGIE